MSPVPWIRLYVSFLDHPKTRKLRRELGTVEPILRLWFWAADCCPSGDITDQTVDDIEDSAHWRGDRGKALKAMQDAGFIEQCGDRLVLHGWNEKTGAGVESLNRARSLTAVRQQRYRNAHSNALPDGLCTANEETTGEERREEERKEEKKEEPPIPPKGGRVRKKRSRAKEPTEGFTRFWETYPADRRNESTEKAFARWPGDEFTDRIISHVEAMKAHGFTYGMRKYLLERLWETVQYDKPKPIYERPKPPPRKTYEPKGDYAAEAAADPERAKPEEQDAEAQRALAELTQRLAEHTTHKET